MSDVPSLLDGLAPWPQVDFNEFGDVEVKPINRIQQLTAKFLGRNWIAIPHVTHHDEIDVTELEAQRKAWNAANPATKITPLVLVIKALTAVLADFPVFSAS